MIVENNNFELPSDLDEKFFNNVLRQGMHIKKPKISKLVVTMGSSGGENYCSTIYRVRIEYNDFAVISVIIKYMADALQTMLDKFYNNELKVLTLVLPAMQNLFNDNVKFGPKYYYHYEGRVPILVMEDLGALNYDVGNRLTGLDDLQAKIVLKKIAMFHASSMVLAERDPELFKPFDWYLFEDRKDAGKDVMHKNIRDNMFFGNVKHVINAFEKYPEFSAVMQKLKKLDIDQVYDLVLKAIDRPNQIKVLNHGDMWVNNLLLRKQTDLEKIDSIFVDFQLSYFGSLGLDLQYFFNTSLRLNHDCDYWLQCYAEHLRSTLEQLNYGGRIPTLDDVRQEFDACQIVGFMAAESILLVVSIDKTESKDNSFDTFLDQDKIQRQFLKVLNTNQRVIDVLKRTIKRADELKLFD